MAIDMNADIGEIFKGLFSNKGEGSKKTKGNENPYSKVIGAGAGVMLIVVCIYSLFIFPHRKSLKLKKKKYHR